MSIQEILQRLSAIVGPAHVRSGDDASSYAVMGTAPKAAVFPGNPEETAAVMSLASQSGLAVIPWGGGTQMDLGERPSAYDVALVLTRLDKVVRYDPDDMTVTVEAGLALTRLQEVLAGGNQFLPVDPPLPGDATVGGVIATRAFGPLRLGFRTIADRLIGIKVVTAQGEIAKAGGRVVKNVSGYEMGRLYTGSFGTLAVIVEATFKVQPQFEVQEALAVAVRGLPAADRMVKAIVHSDALGVAMELAGPYRDAEDLIRRLEQEASQSTHFEKPDADGDVALLVLGYGGTEESVDWQINEALAIMRREIGADQTLIHRRLPWNHVHNLLLDLHGRKDSDTVMLRVHVPDAALVSQIEDGLRRSKAADLPVRYAAHAGSGVARVACFPADTEPSLRAAIDFARELRAAAEARGGFMVVERAPGAIKGEVGVWSPPRDDFFLHRAVKDKMDPKGLLSPGRFVGGL